MPDSEGYVPTSLTGEQFERAICGAALRWPTFLDDLAQTPKPEDFRLLGASQLWEAILQCRTDTGKVTSARVIQTVQQLGMDAKAAAETVRLIEMELTERDNAHEAAKFICARALRQRAMNVAGEFMQAFMVCPELKAPEIVERFEKTVIDLSHNAEQGDAWVRLDAIENSVNATIPTGWDNLDRLTGGIAQGVLTIVAARPGMGKSAFAFSMARQIALRGGGVGIFSLEMKREDVRDRIAASHAYRPGVFMSGVSDNPYYATAQRGELTPSQQMRFDAALHSLRGMPVSIDDRKGLKMGKIRIAARRLQAEMARNSTPLSVLFIDHLQHIRPDIDRRGNKTAETTDITGALMEMAAELGVAVVALSQLNRETEKRTDKRPTMADLRESGSIEQDAHTIMLLYRPAYYFDQARKAGEDVSASDEANARHDFEINVVKQRNGPTERLTMFTEIGANAFLDTIQRSSVRAA